MMVYMDSGFKITPIHDRINDEGETYPDPETPQKRTIPRKSKSMMWKILNRQIKEIYYSLVCRGLFQEEQRDCRMETRRQMTY